MFSINTKINHGAIKLNYGSSGARIKTSALGINPVFLRRTHIQDSICVSLFYQFAINGNTVSID